MPQFNFHQWITTFCIAVFLPVDISVDKDAFNVEQDLTQLWIKKVDIHRKALTKNNPHAIHNLITGRSRALRLSKMLFVLINYYLCTETGFTNNKHKRIKENDFLLFAVFYNFKKFIPNVVN